VEIRPDAEGFVKDISFERGQEVQARQILFVLDSNELQEQRKAARAELEAVEARLANAKRTFNRVQSLYARDAATLDELDEARTQRDARLADRKRLQARIDLLTEQIADTRIGAPVAGEVTDHRVDVGDYVRRGDLLATLYTADALEVRFRVGQQALGRVKTGQSVRLTVDAFEDRTFEAAVVYVGPAVQAGTRELPIVAVLDSDKGLLKPGAFVSAEVTIESRTDVPGIPEEALIAGREGYDVFVLADGMARRTSVEVGLRKPGRAEITQGLEIGQTVVRSGHLQLRDGQRVRVVTDDEAAGDGEASSTPTEGGE
jgi:membrane fusion protein (multidrug efflux system)